jgi:hypothetical protein
MISGDGKWMAFFNNLFNRAWKCFSSPVILSPHRFGPQIRSHVPVTHPSGSRICSSLCAMVDPVHLRHFSAFVFVNVDDFGMFAFDTGYLTSPNP